MSTFVGSHDAWRNNVNRGDERMRLYVKIDGKANRGRGRGRPRGHRHSVKRENFTVKIENGGETNGESRVKTVPTPGEARTISISKTQTTDGDNMDKIKVKSFEEIMREKKQKKLASEASQGEANDSKPQPVSSHAEPTPSCSVALPSRHGRHLMLKTLSIPLKALPKYTPHTARVSRPQRIMTNSSGGFSNDEETFTNNNVLSSPLKQKIILKQEVEPEIDEDELLMTDDDDDDPLEGYTELSETSDMFNIDNMDCVDYSDVPLGGSHDETSMDEILSLHPDDSMFDEDEGESHQGASHRLSGKFSSNRRQKIEPKDARELLNKQRASKAAIKQQSPERKVEERVSVNEDNLNVSDDLDDSGAHERSWQEEKNNKVRKQPSDEHNDHVTDKDGFKVPVGKQGKKQDNFNKNRRGKGNKRGSRGRGGRNRDRVGVRGPDPSGGIDIEKLKRDAIQIQAMWSQQLLSNPIVTQLLNAGARPAQVDLHPREGLGLLGAPPEMAEQGQSNKRNIPSLLDHDPVEHRIKPGRIPRLKDRGNPEHPRDRDHGLHMTGDGDYHMEYERRNSRSNETSPRSSGHSTHSSPRSSPREDPAMKRRSNSNDQPGGKLARKSPREEREPKPYPLPEGYCFSQYQVGVCGFKYCKLKHFASEEDINKYKMTGALPTKKRVPEEKGPSQEQQRKLEEEKALKLQQERQQQYEDLSKAAGHQLKNRNLGEDDAGEACRILETMYQIDSSPKEVFIRHLEKALFLCGEDDVDANTASQVACKVFDLIGKARSRYTRHDFTTLIGALCRKGQYIRAYEILKLMKENHVQPTHDVFLNLIQSSHADPEWAFQLVDEIKEVKLFRTSICSALILLGSHGNTQLEKTWSLFEEMVACKVKLSKDAFLSLVNLLTAVKDHEKLMSVLKHYEDSTIVISPETLKAAIEFSVGQEEMVETAATVVSKRAEHVDPGLERETWNTLLMSCCNQRYNKVKHIQHIYALMGQYNIPVFPAGYSHVLSSLAKANLVTQSMDVFEVMIHDPDVCRFPRDCLEGIASVFALMQKVGNDEGLYKVAEFMVEKGIEVNEGPLMRIISKYEQEKSYEKLYNLFKKFAIGQLIPPYPVIHKIWACLEAWSANPAAAVEVYATKMQLFPAKPEDSKPNGEIELSAPVPASVPPRKPCIYFAVDRCRFGDICRFSHAKQEMTVPPQPQHNVKQTEQQETQDSFALQSRPPGEKHVRPVQPIGVVPPHGSALHCGNRPLLPTPHIGARPPFHPKMGPPTGPLGTEHHHPPTNRSEGMPGPLMPPRGSHPSACPNPEAIVVPVTASGTMTRPPMAPRASHPSAGSRDEENVAANPPGIATRPPIPGREGHSPSGSHPETNGPVNAPGMTGSAFHPRSNHPQDGSKSERNNVPVSRPGVMTNPSMHAGPIREPPPPMHAGPIRGPPPPMLTGPIREPPPSMHAGPIREPPPPMLTGPIREPPPSMHAGPIREPPPPMHAGHIREPPRRMHPGPIREPPPPMHPGPIRGPPPMPNPPEYHHAVQRPQLPNRGPFVLKNNRGRFGLPGMQQSFGPRMPGNPTNLSPTSPFRLGPQQVSLFSTSRSIPSTGIPDRPGNLQHGMARHSFDTSTSTASTGMSARGTQSAPVYSGSSDGKFKFPTRSTAQFYRPRIMGAAEENEWEEVARLYVEMKAAEVPVENEMQYLFYQAFISSGVQGCGEAFSSFVGVLDGLLFPEGDGSGSPSEVLDAVDQRFLGALGVALMQICLSAKEHQDGYYVLHALHQNGVAYFSYTADFIPNSPPTSPSSVALTAVQICLGLSQPAYDGAIEVLRGCNYALPSPGTILKPNDAALRSSLFEKLALYYFNNNSVAEAEELLNNVGDKNAFGTNTLKTLYNDLLRCYLRLGYIDESVATICKMESEFIPRDSDVLRVLTTSLAAVERILAAKELFNSSCLQGVYPVFPSGSELWNATLWTTFSKFETQFYLERHLQQLNSFVEKQRIQSKMPYDEKFFQALRISIVDEPNQQVPSSPRVMIGLQESVIKILQNDFNPPLSCGMSDKPGEVIVNPRSLRRWFLANPPSGRNSGRSQPPRNSGGEQEHRRNVVTSYIRPGMTIKVGVNTNSDQTQAASPSSRSREVALSQDEEHATREMKEKVRHSVCSTLTRYMREGKIASRDEFRKLARNITEEFLRRNSIEELQRENTRDSKAVRNRINSFISGYYNDLNGGESNFF